MYKIVEINKKIIYNLINELNNYSNFFGDLPLNFSDGKISLNNISDRSVLQKAFEIINSSVVLSKITCDDLGIELNSFLNYPMLWTYPQLRIDCEANRKFEAPLHKDGFILGKELKGIVVWLPINFEGASLDIITNPGKTFIKKNDYWGLECHCEDNTSTKIDIKFGEALIFDQDLIHRSNPIEKGQITLQLRFFEPETEFFYRPVVQKSSEPIIEYQKNLSK